MLTIQFPVEFKQPSFTDLLNQNSVGFFISHWTINANRETTTKMPTRNLSWMLNLIEWTRLMANCKWQQCQVIVPNMYWPLHINNWWCLRLTVCVALPVATTSIEMRGNPIQLDIEGSTLTQIRQYRSAIGHCCWPSIACNGHREDISLAWYLHLVCTSSLSYSWWTACMFCFDASNVQPCEHGFATWKLLVHNFSPRATMSTRGKVAISLPDKSAI